MLTMLNAPKLQDAHPRVYEQLCAVWGSKRCYDYLKELTIQDGDMQRQGFDFGVLMELSQLITLHNEQFPKYDYVNDIYHNRL